MKKLLILSIFLVLLSGCTINNDTQQKTKTSQIALTAINGSDLFNKLNTKEFGCDDKIVAVSLKNKTDIKDTLTDMFQYKNTDSKLGYYNVFEHLNLPEIQSISVDKDNIAIIYLSGEINSAGTCDDPRIITQIKETIKLNNYASDVEIYINGEKINSYLSEKDEIDVYEDMTRDITDIDLVIKNLDQIKSHIDNHLQYFESFEQEIIGESSEGGNATYYEDSYVYPAIYRKIIAEYYGEMGKSIYTLYFDIHGSLIYISQYEYDYNMPMYTPEFDDKLTTIQKNKYYFYDNNLIKREINDNKGTQNIDRNSEEFKEKQAYLIKYSQELSE